MRRAWWLLVVLLGSAWPVSAQNWVVTNGANSVTMNTTAPGVTIRQNGSGQAICVQNAVGTNTWCVSAGGIQAQGTLLTDAQAISTTATWNNSATTFTHWKAVITDTASASGSLAVNILGGSAGATTLFSLSKAGAGVFGAGLSVASTGTLTFGARSIVSSTADGNLLITNNAGTSGGLLQLGGTTSSFTGAQSNGTTFEIKLADGSGFAGVKAGSANFTGTVQTVNSLSTAGSFGVPVNVAVYETTGNTAAVTNAINYTPASASSTYEMVGVVNVTAWTTPASFTVALTYKDASGNARTDTAQVVRGSTGVAAAAVTAIDRWYFTFPAIDIDNSGTAITVSTTGTFTGTPVYNLQADLRRTR